MKEEHHSGEGEHHSSEESITYGRKVSLWGIHHSYWERSLLRRLQVQTLPNEAPPMGKIHPLRKIAVTFKPGMQIGCPWGFLISLKMVTMSII